MPLPQDLPEGLSPVLQVIYLVFNEGYSAAAGAGIIRAELTGEAIRLGRLICELLPEPEVMGLLALMLLQESHRAARTSPAGDLILLEQQDRALWDRAQIAEGIGLVESLSRLTVSAPTHCRLRLRLFTLRQTRLLPRTGGRSSCFTTAWRKSSLPR